MNNTIIISKSNLDANFNLTAEHNLVFDKYNKAYQKLLNKKFKNQTKWPLGRLYEVKKQTEFEKRCVHLAPSFNGILRYEVIEEGFFGKKYFTLIIPKEDNNYTSNYLVWFLSHKDVQNYLSILTIGSIQRIIPIAALESLLIPEPIAEKKYRKREDSIVVEDSSYRKLINLYYRDFKRNYDEGSYMTAAILAGAIAEVILYELLVDYGVEQSLLEGKTLGGLIRDIQLLKLQEEFDFPITHFHAIQKLRNQAVHAGLAIGNIEIGAEVEKHEFEPLNQIIKYFGI